MLRGYYEPCVLPIWYVSFGVVPHVPERDGAVIHDVAPVGPAVPRPDLDPRLRVAMPRSLTLAPDLYAVEGAARSVSEDDDAWVRWYYCDFGWRKGDNG